MKPTIEILTRLQENSKNNHDEVFTKVFRYLLRPDIYYVAYQNLYANNGAATKGVDDDTADGFSEDKVNRIIDALKNGTYEPKPVRRTYIKKKNGKQRPLGLPTFTDKLVQDAIRMILQAIYEPNFSNYSHGFRPGRSCHTALAQIKHEFIGAKWFVEGDIKGCFDNIDHTVLIEIISRKIKDARFINLIRQFLKAGYAEEWKYYGTYSGCPQGGIISPILANIYLNELDKYVAKLKEEFDTKTPYTLTPEYKALQQKRANTRKKINRREDGEERDRLIAYYVEIGKELRKTPAKLCNDKKLKYVRYADDFLIAVNGSKADCEQIKAKLAEFIRGTLKMELSEEKTLITHSNESARFLGYDVRVRRDSQVKPWKNCKQRTLNNTVELLIPFKDKIEKYLFSKNAVIQRKDNGRLESVARLDLTRNTDLEIVTVYDAELRGLCNYYYLASNYRNLNYFSYLMEYSCLKTLAWKHKCKISKIYDKYRIGAKRWGIPYDTKKGKKVRKLTKFNEIEEKRCEDVLPTVVTIIKHGRTTIDSRLKAHQCELCGYEGTDRKYEVHHVNKVKNLKGKEPWEIVMIAKKRKTMVVCHECHQMIHHGS